LKVRRPKLTEAPEPPKELIPFLQAGWQHIDYKVVLDTTKKAMFDSDPRLKRRLEEWVLHRNSWAETERPTRTVQSIYEQLDKVSSQLTREAEHVELVLGDGVLSWYPTSTNGVHHPVLLLRLQLHFNPQIPEYTLAETEHPAEFYTTLFQTLPELGFIHWLDKTR